MGDARQILANIWGYTDFRWAQRRVVLGALRGRDVLAVLPTGGGKSLCFQVPALVLPGTTIVVSPLISLMQDQVGALQSRGVAAAYLSSSQRPGEQRVVWNAYVEGRLKLLYVAPERMSQLLERKPAAPTPLLAIDEAHCISEWGHDFRPHYRSLGQHRYALGRPPTIALTASATPDTRNDIVRLLRMRTPLVAVNSFDRPNLHFSVKRATTQLARLQETAALLKRHPETAIVYVPTRNRTDGVAAVLRRWGFVAAPYHAGLPSKDRTELLQQFLDGRVRVMVATNAFGMGIDKPDVRLVIHLGIPTRPEAYYQEAGRAGRDGEPAWCRLIWLKDDLRLASAMAMEKTTTRAATASGHLRARKAALQTMREYVSSRRCRRKILLGYLGEEVLQCSGCDRCT
ncbi:MAG: ATP-dependent DNA helicase [Gemmatimonadetes bacterium]|nr:ATP-dependent DNA helicase [Gemmatimonadota bacterium]